MLEDMVAPVSDLDPKELHVQRQHTREVPQPPSSRCGRARSSATSATSPFPSPTSSSRRSASATAAPPIPGVYWEKADLRIVLHLDQVGLLPARADAAPRHRRGRRRRRAGRRRRPPRCSNFMIDGALEQRRRSPATGRARTRGTMPIFYTDVPFAAGSGCAHGAAGVRQRRREQLRSTIPAPLPDRCATPNAPQRRRRLRRVRRGDGQRARRSLRPRLPPRRLLQPARSASGCCCSTSTSAT